MNTTDASPSSTGQVRTKCTPRTIRKGKQKAPGQQPIFTQTSSSTFTTTPALKAARTRAWKTYRGFAQDEVDGCFPANSFVTLRTSGNRFEPLETSFVTVVREKEGSHSLGSPNMEPSVGSGADILFKSNLAEEEVVTVKKNKMPDEVDVSTPGPPHYRRQRPDSQSMGASQLPANRNKRPRTSTEQAQICSPDNHADFNKISRELPLDRSEDHPQVHKPTTNFDPGRYLNSQAEISHSNFPSRKPLSFQSSSPSRYGVRQETSPYSTADLRPTVLDRTQSSHHPITTTEEESSKSQFLFSGWTWAEVLDDNWLNSTTHNTKRNSNTEKDNGAFSLLPHLHDTGINAFGEVSEPITPGQPTCLSPEDSKSQQPTRNLKFDAMAPVRDPNSVEGALKDAVQTLYEVQSQVHGFVPETQPLLIDKMTELARSLAHIQTITSPTSSPNNPIHKYHVAPEIIDYVDDSRNPDIYNREFVELVQRGNAVINGKQQAFRDFSEVFAQALKEGFDGMDEQVDKIMINADLTEKTADKTNAEGGPTNGTNKQ